MQFVRVLSTKLHAAAALLRVFFLMLASVVGKLSLLNSVESLRDDALITNDTLIIIIIFFAERSYAKAEFAFTNFRIL